MFSVSKAQNYVLILLLSLSTAFGGYYLGVRGFEVNVKTDKTPISVQNKQIPVDIINKSGNYPKSVDFERFWEVWDMVNEKHVKRPLNPEKLLDGAIHGMVNAIEDPYSAYFNTDENKVAQDSLNGKYEGIGAQLGLDKDKTLIIQTPIDGSPAKEAGILPGDKIIAINGIDTYGMSINDAVSKIRGPANTTVTLSLYRDSFEKPKDFLLTRRTITIESVKWEDKKDGIAYIRLSRFGETTNNEWDKAISEIKYQMPNLKGVILDVRNNPGGYLESAVHVSSEFIRSGTVVTEDRTDGTKNKYDINRVGGLLDNKIKVVVLINEGSASAAEIVSAALKERRNAILVGTRSFGKGSVQKPEDFDDGASLHVTIAKWLTPDNNWIDKYNSEFSDSKYNELDKDGKEIKGGIKPDIETKFTDEDIKNNKDVQLDKAMEQLK